MTHGILREQRMQAQTPRTPPMFVGEFAHSIPSTAPSITATAQGTRSSLTPSGGGGGGGQATPSPDVSPSPHSTQAAQVLTQSLN